MIDTIKDNELEMKKEELLKNMKMLRHTVMDMLGSKSFFKDIKPGVHNGIIGINGEIFPVYISADTLVIDTHQDITDDIFDADNYLSLLTDDDLMWYALVEHLAHQTELLQEDNNKYNDDLVAANEEIDNLNCKVAEEIKARRGYEESLTQLREELTAADNEIEGLEQYLREANRACTEYVHRIDKLEHENGVLKNENADLNQKLYQKEDEDDLRKRIAEYAQKYDEVLDYNKRLRQEITKLRVETGRSLADSVEPHVVTADDDMKYTVSLETMNELTAKIKELEAENDRLRQEISKLRVQLNSYSGATVVDNKDLQQTITQEAMSELTARINELESINENLQKENESLKNKNLKTNKEKQQKKYNHLKHILELLNDIMEMDNEI